MKVYSFYFLYLIYLIFFLVNTYIHYFGDILDVINIGALTQWFTVICIIIWGYSLNFEINNLTKFDQIVIEYLNKDNN